MVCIDSALFIYNAMFPLIYYSYKLGSERKAKSRLRSMENNVVEVNMLLKELNNGRHG